MIKVYVVDDEKLVRQGIIGLIEWEKYDMEVVGNSGSGEETILFLRENEVNILFSDLEMPGLSGMDFLKEVKETQPDTHIVVLTMYQEFELIQQSLRIGILDYITKAQIEEENVHAFMSGVRKRYLESIQLYDRVISDNEVYIWITEGSTQRENAMNLLKEYALAFELLGDSYIFFSGECNCILLMHLVELSGGQQSVLVELKQVKGISHNQLKDILDREIKILLFRERKPGNYRYTFIYPELPEIKRGDSRQEILSSCMKMEFMLDTNRYEEVIERIRCADLSSEERTAVFYHFNLYWSEFSGRDIRLYFDEVAYFKCWYQWREWFDQIHIAVQKRIGNTGTGIGTMELIHKAIIYIREHMDREIALDDLLHITGMSKSFFSRNFKKVTGKTFITYLNDMRIDSAKKYLIETEQSVHWIAIQVGYVDEHYFRKLFKDKTGKSPKKYRESQNDQN